jgi:hypothetical protein
MVIVSRAEVLEPSDMSTRSGFRGQFMSDHRCAVPGCLPVYCHMWRSGAVAMQLHSWTNNRQPICIGGALIYREALPGRRFDGVLKQTWPTV